MKTRSDASLPDFLEPMQAKLVDSMRPGDWIYEIKFDGYRALALRGGGETRIMSRNKKDLGKKFPAIAGSIAKLDVQDALCRIPFYAAPSTEFPLARCSPVRHKNGPSARRSSTEGINSLAHGDTANPHHT
jgi:ATP dependent DNA ligase domain